MNGCHIDAVVLGGLLVNTSDDCSSLGHIVGTTNLQRGGRVEVREEGGGEEGGGEGGGEGGRQR